MKYLTLFFNSKCYNLIDIIYFFAIQFVFELHKKKDPMANLELKWLQKIKSGILEKDIVLLFYYLCFVYGEYRRIESEICDFEITENTILDSKTNEQCNAIC